MLTGFASVNVNPPLGTPMMGFGSRDRDHGCEAIHDDVFVRACYLEHDGAAALLLGYDMCFVGRADADRFKGAIGRWLDLTPSQVLINTSHSHVGPMVGTWYDAHPAPGYVDQLCVATVQAAREAHAAAVEVTMWAGEATTRLPMSRRRKVEGGYQNAPNPGGFAYDRVPLCLLRDRAGAPVCLIFSVSCHPSMVSGWEISSEYPGYARLGLAEHLGADVSLFLQGVGGDAKPSIMGEGPARWDPAAWEDVERAGRMVAEEVIPALDDLRQIKPGIATATREVDWPLEPPQALEWYEAEAANEELAEVRRIWAAGVAEKLRAGEPLPAAATLTVQGVRLGEGLRLVGIEGEAVSEWGPIIAGCYDAGVTFPMGYANGEGLYLPVTRMLDEGGYEVVSFWEYGYPSRLTPGFEETMLATLADLRDARID